MTLTLLISNQIHKTWELTLKSTGIYLRRQEMDEFLNTAKRETEQIRYDKECVFYWQILSKFSRVRHEPQQKIKPLILSPENMPYI